MNREIKFRVWCPTSKHYTTQPWLSCDGLMMKWDHTGEESTHTDIRFDKYVIQQYTGFKDKHGKEIYEGDWCFADNQRVIIIFKDGMFGYDTCLGMHCILIPELMEVIGNKFEQEELIRIYKTKEFY